jgi:hypothetical protein
MDIKTCVALIHLYFVNNVLSQSDVSAYTSTVTLCSSDLFMNTNIIETHENCHGKIDCMRRCTRDFQCRRAVYQEFGARPSCTKLSVSSNNSSTILDVSASNFCVVIFVNPCLNGGYLYQDICICQHGFAGKSIQDIVIIIHLHCTFILFKKFNLFSKNKIQPFFISIYFLFLFFN